MCLKAVMLRFTFAFSFYLISIKADSCGGVLAWGEEIYAPTDREGYYQNNLHCVFETKFKGEIDPNVLLLKWFKFDISGTMADSCTTDYLEIFVSCSYKSLGRFCGKHPPSVVISPDRCLRIVFHSDEAGSGRGFKARLIVTARLRNLTPLHNYRHLVQLNASAGSHGILSSPGYPGYYPPHPLSQTFVFETRQKQRTAMRLYFMEFDIGGADEICQTPEDDILMIEVSKVHKNEIIQENHRMCGPRKPFVLTWSDYTSVHINFTTNNDSRVSRGFVAGYMIYQTGNSSRNNTATDAWEGHSFTCLVFASAYVFAWCFRHL